jgi:hypothetical protein
MSKEYVKVKRYRKYDRYIILEREKIVVLLEGSQASSAWPADNSRVQVKTLEWLETVA